MFIVFNDYCIPVYETENEAEAEAKAYQIDGYYCSDDNY